jgi:hypothetical protein
MVLINARVHSEHVTTNNRKRHLTEIGGKIYKSSLYETYVFYCHSLIVYKNTRYTLVK